MAYEWAYRLGVEDASFGVPAGNPAAPITPESRERYLMGYNSVEAKRAANANLLAQERARKAKSQAAWNKKLNGPPEDAKPERKKRERHPHGSDW